MRNRGATHPALIDHDAGLPNGDYFDAVFGVIFGLGDRGIPISVLVMKVEHDEYDWAEHEEARGAIARLGEVLKGSTRGADLYAYMGEGLFAAILLDCNAQGALTVAHRLEDVLEDWREETASTLSIGVAAWHPDLAEPEDLWKLASEALEKSRTGGGGRAQLASG